MIDRDTKREASVDLMKGICILFVVLNHCGPSWFSEGLLMAIRSVYLPAFFFCSGLFLSTDGGFRQFIVKKTNMLIVPFVFICLVSIIFILIIPPKEYYGDIDWSSPAFYFRMVARPYSLPTWFLRAIFWTFLFTYAIIRLVSKFWIQLLVVTVLWAAGCCLNEAWWEREQGFGWLIFNSNIVTGMMTVPFMFAGYRLRKIGLLEWRPSNIPVIIIAIVCSLIFFGSGSKYYVSYFSGYFELPYTMHLLITFGGIALLWIICMKVTRLPVLSLLGEYSLIVLCVHYYGIQVADYLGLNSTGILLLFCAAFVFAGIWLLPKYLPWVVGRKPLFKVPEVTRDDKVHREESSSPDKPVR